MAPALIPLLSDCLAGHRLTPGEGEFLMKSTGRDVFRITAAADEMREKKVGDIVTYVRNQNLHVTNICKNLCGFCGFGKKATDPGAYCLDRDTIQAGVRQAQKRNVTEICFLSGVNPAFDLRSYMDLIAAVHEIAPEIHVHAFSPDEVAHAAKRGQLATAEVLAALRTPAWVMQGTAAEILIESVREGDLSAKDSPVPNGCGSSKRPISGHPHLRHHHVRLLRVCPRPGGPYGDHPSGPGRDTRVYRVDPDVVYPSQYPTLYRGDRKARATGREDLLMIAVSRLFLDNFDNVQVSWGKSGSR